MVAVMILFTVLISVIFVMDFTKMILEIHRDREMMKSIKREAGGFSV